MSNRDFFEAIAGNVDPAPGWKIDIPGGATLTYLGTQLGRGALSGILHIAEFALSFGLGVSSSIVANWIYEKFKNHNITRVRIDKKIIEVTPDGFVRVITEHLER